MRLNQDQMLFKFPHKKSVFFKPLRLLKLIYKCKKKKKSLVEGLGFHLMKRNDNFQRLDPSIWMLHRWSDGKEDATQLLLRAILRRNKKNKTKKKAPSQLSQIRYPIRSLICVSAEAGGNVRRHVAPVFLSRGMACKRHRRHRRRRDDLFVKTEQIQQRSTCESREAADDGILITTSFLSFEQKRKKQEKITQHHRREKNSTQFF